MDKIINQGHIELFTTYNKAGGDINLAINFLKEQKSLYITIKPPEIVISGNIIFSEENLKRLIPYFTKLIEELDQFTSMEDSMYSNEYKISEMEKLLSDKKIRFPAPGK